MKLVFPQPYLQWTALNFEVLPIEEIFFWSNLIFESRSQPNRTRTI